LNSEAAKMSGCLDNLNMDNFRINWEEQRNNISAVGSGFLFSLGVWLYIDTAAYYTPSGGWNNAYIIVTIASIVAMFMVNSISNSQIHGGSYDYEGILGTRGARLWLMLAFILSFSSLVAALWLMFADYVFETGDGPKWPGVALFLNNFLIFCASLVYKFGRAEGSAY